MQKSTTLSRSLSEVIDWLFVDLESARLVEIHSQIMEDQQEKRPPLIAVERSGQNLMAAACIRVLPNHTSRLIGFRYRPGHKFRLMAAWQSLIQQLHERRSLLVNALYHPTDSSLDLSVLHECGFVRKTQVKQYWLNAAQYNVAHLSLPGFEWIPARLIKHSKFVELYRRTTSDSFDSSTDQLALGIQTDKQVATSLRARENSMDGRLWCALCHQEDYLACLLLHQLSPELMLIDYLGVATEVRRQGLGQESLRQAVRISRRLAVPLLLVAVDAANHHASKLYEKFGFVQHTSYELFELRLRHSH